MKKEIQKLIEFPETTFLDRQCRWIYPEFEPIDGIGELELWTLKGLIVAIGFIDDENQKIIGSGVMIAPGLCLTATHVIVETQEKKAILYSFASRDGMRIWAPIDFHAIEKRSLQIIPFQKKQPRYCDVGILSYSPLSKFTDTEDYLFAHLEVSAPKIHERLWATGYREIDNNGVPTISFFITSGLVTEQYLQGRGSHINGPCVEVAMDALGGMSGGPVFNDKGKVVGVISSSLEGHNDTKGPTYVSLIWTSLLSTVHTPWPENHWPENIAGIQTKIDKYGVHLSGSARIDRGSYKVKFPKQSSDEMLSILKTAGIKFPRDDYDFQDFSNANFEEFLKDEGVKHLSTVDKEIFDEALSNTPYTETIKLFNCVDASVREGLEDLDIESVKLLDNGNIGIDARFNIRIIVLLLQISVNENEYYKNLISSLVGLAYKEVVGDYVSYEYCVRVFYKVTFTYDVMLQDCRDVKFQFFSIKI